MAGALDAFGPECETDTLSWDGSSVVVGVHLLLPSGLPRLPWRDGVGKEEEERK